MDDFIGLIALYPDPVLPPNWVPCDGRLLPAGRFGPLHSLLGTRFGGDGRATFAIPDYRGLAPRGSRYCIHLQGIFPEEEWRPH